MNAVTSSESILGADTSPTAHEPSLSSTTTPKPRRPRVWTTFATLFGAVIAGQMAIIAGFVAIGLTVGITMGAQGADPAAIQVRVQEICQQPLVLVLMSLIPFQLGMLAVVLLAARLSKQPLKQRLGLVPPPARTFGGIRLASMAAFTLAAALASVIGVSLLLGAPPAGTPMAAVISDGSWWAVSLLSIVLSALPAVIEELVFRGYVQRRLLQRWSPAVAIGVSSLLFAVMHMDSLQHVIAVVPLAVVTGLLAWRTNSVKPGMLVHALHNMGAVAYGAFAVAITPYFGEDGVGIVTITGIVVLGIVGLPAVIALLRNAKPRPIVDFASTPNPKPALPVPEFGTDSKLAGQAM